MSKISRSKERANNVINNLEHIVGSLSSLYNEYKMMELDASRNDDYIEACKCGAFAESIDNARIYFETMLMKCKTKSYEFYLYDINNIIKAMNSLTCTYNASYIVLGILKRERLNLCIDDVPHDLEFTLLDTSRSLILNKRYAFITDYTDSKLKIDYNNGKITDVKVFDNCYDLGVISDETLETFLNDLMS